MTPSRPSPPRARRSLGAPARAWARRVGSAPAFGRAVSVLEQVDRWDVDLLPVLTYHRVDQPDNDALSPSLLSATPNAFRAQIAHLTRHFRILSAEELLDVRRGAARLPRRALVLTFDDAYTCFAEHAWPVLRAAGCPAILFVPTSFMGRPEPFWWDTLHHALMTTRRAELPSPVGVLRLDDRGAREDAFRRLREHVKSLPHLEVPAFVHDLCGRLEADPPPASVLGWPDLRRLASEGVALAPHTRTHPMLDRMPVDDVHEELASSAVELHRETGAGVPMFAYPSGRYDARVVDAVGASGYEVAFTTRRGVNRLGRTPWLELRRINVGSSTSLALMRGQLLPTPGRLHHTWTRRRDLTVGEPA